ncbi:MAG: disulfide bond formation protein B [Alphaproteobacteria bacterium]|nr:disulfide bond formation protein B [Alphaproteobacteria bacterium]
MNKNVFKAQSIYIVGFVAALQVLLVLFFALNISVQKYEWLVWGTTTGTLLLEIAFVVCVISLCISSVRKVLFNVVEKYGWYFIFFLSASSITTSLLYSVAYGVLPCVLCVLQRIGMYPLAPLSLLAMYTQIRVEWYALVVSVFAGSIAAYHHYIQLVGESSLPCSATGPQCTDRSIFSYAHITFPYMAVVVCSWVILICAMFLYKRYYASGKLKM